MSTKNRVLLLAILCLVLLLELKVCMAQNTHQTQPMHRMPRQFNDAQTKNDCKEKCDYRCSKASRYRMCFRACNTCCQRCNCVPPGTAGNAETCPCWNNMVNSSGKKRCP